MAEDIRRETSLTDLLSKDEISNFTELINTLEVDDKSLPTLKPQRLPPPLVSVSVPKVSAPEVSPSSQPQPVSIPIQKLPAKAILPPELIATLKPVPTTISVTPPKPVKPSTPAVPEPAVPEPIKPAPPSFRADAVSFMPSRPIIDTQQLSEVTHMKSAFLKTDVQSRVHSIINQEIERESFNFFNDCNLNHGINGFNFRFTVIRSSDSNLYINFTTTYNGYELFNKDRGQDNDDFHISLHSNLGGHFGGSHVKVGGVRKDFIFRRVKKADGTYGDIEVNYVRRHGYRDYRDDISCDYINQIPNNILLKRKTRMNPYTRQYIDVYENTLAPLFQYPPPPPLPLLPPPPPIALYNFVLCIIDVMPAFLQHIIKKLTVPLESGYVLGRQVSSPPTYGELQTATGGALQDKYYLKYLKYKQKYLELKNKK